MRISRLYIEAEFTAGTELELTKEQAHYVLTVLRLKNATVIEAFDGNGHLARGQLNVSGRRSASLLIESVEQSSSESPVNTTLVQGISRGDRMDYSIQKAVELGINAIQPIFTSRCEVKLKGDKLEKRQQQWQTIVINACEQSGRTFVPKVLPIIDFEQWLNQQDAQSFGLVMDPYASNTLASLEKPTAQQNIQILVGPEGGLTEDEVQKSICAGMKAIQLGPRVLRTETAGPATLAIIQALWGDFC